MRLSIISLVMFVIAQSAAPAMAEKTVKEITQQARFDQLLKTSGDRLLVVDFNALWCGPCRMLSPRLERVAEANKKYADFYKINVDALGGVAARYHVRSIPFVAFIKNGKTVHTMIGLQSENAYTSAVRQYAGVVKKAKPSGTVIDGIRVIKLKKGRIPETLTVYLWEKIRLILPGTNETRILKIPALAVKASARPGKELVLNTSARRQGEFTVKLIHGQPVKEEILTKIRIVKKPKSKRPVPKKQ